MAAGSKALALRARDAAGYSTQNYSGARCDGCTYCRRPAITFNSTKYARQCGLHRIAVLTHGHCSKWKGKSI